MHARIRWVENAAFMAETGSGHAIIVDGPETVGGRNIGPRPMELMLASVGGCAATDVVQILKKARQTVAGCEVTVSGTRAEVVPKVFTKIHLHFIVTGKKISESHTKRAVALSAKKYCSASIMLSKAVAVTHDYEVIDTDDH